MPRCDGLVCTQRSSCCGAGLQLWQGVRRTRTERPSASLAPLFKWSVNYAVVMGKGFKVRARGSVSAGCATRQAHDWCQSAAPLPRIRHQAATPRIPTPKPPSLSCPTAGGEAWGLLGQPLLERLGELRAGALPEASLSYLLDDMTVSWQFVRLTCWAWFAR